MLRIDCCGWNYYHHGDEIDTSLFVATVQYLITEN